MFSSQSSSHYVKSSKVVSYETQKVNRARSHVTTSHVDLSRNYNDQLADRMFYSTTAIDSNGLADSSSTRYSGSSGTVAYNNTRRSSSNTSSEGSIREFVINPDPLDQEGTYSVGIIFDRTVNDYIKDKSSVTVEARSPSGRLITFSGETNYTARFDASEIGRWTVKILYNGHCVESGSIYVCDPCKVRVKGPSHGTVGEMIRYRVNSLEAGPGDIKLEVLLGEKKIPADIEGVKKQVVKADFIPRVPGTYRVKVKYNGVEIKDITQVTSPKPVIHKAVFFMKIDDDEFGAKINLKCDWKMDYEQGTPFWIQVDTQPDIQIIDNSDGETNNVELLADCNRAGDGLIEATATHNGKVIPVEVVERQPRVYAIKFTPDTPGSYKIRIFYDGKEAKCSPFIHVIDALMMPIAYGDGLVHAFEGRPCVFYVNPYGQRGNLSVQIKGQNSELHQTITLDPNGHYKVCYKPVELGRHTIHVKWSNQPLDGSPFHPTVVNPDRVRVLLGSNNLLNAAELQSNDKIRVPLVVNEQKQLEFHTRDAGPGELTAEVLGPTKKVPIIIDSPNSTTKIISFTPREEGSHQIEIFWSGYALPRSPYEGYATQQPVQNVRPDVPLFLSVPNDKRPITPTPSVTSSGKRSPSFPKVILKGYGLKEAKVGYPASFTVDGTDADYGEPYAKLTGYNQQDAVEVYTRHLGQNVYMCEYTPVKPGAHLLSILWNGRKLKGSPYKVNVHPPDYHQKILMVDDFPKRLQNPTVGSRLSLKFNPQDGGIGMLTAECLGPSGLVPCHVNRNPDASQSVRVTPREPGKHLLQIKYDEIHVMGSPYELDVGVSKHTGKVVVSGPGLQDGILDHYNSNFMVNTQNAGPGELKVSIMGPKGAFKTEMHRNSHADKIFTCSYRPIEAGVYTIHVKWSGVNVSGSPFIVHLAETRDELSRMLFERISMTHEPRYPDTLY
ncbi:filamin-A-like [Octopus sinensis]|uniref:Filamin-A-like n=1 Tax=Octopus sinensis TaxID=2607531 RepID=A0A6P7TEG1_9MOLL|nr:filamin-A-like [Octopus sinensis]